MHESLPCTLSRLSSSEPGAIVPVSGCLPGLHPIHLPRSGTGMIDVPFAAVLPIASEGHPTAAPSPSLCGSARRVLGGYGGTVLDPSVIPFTGFCRVRRAVSPRPRASDGERRRSERRRLSRFDYPACAGR